MSNSLDFVVCPSHCSTLSLVISGLLVLFILMNRMYVLFMSINNNKINKKSIRLVKRVHNLIWRVYNFKYQSFEVWTEKSSLGNTTLSRISPQSHFRHTHTIPSRQKRARCKLLGSRGYKKWRGKENAWKHYSSRIGSLQDWALPTWREHVMLRWYGRAILWIIVLN